MTPFTPREAARDAYAAAQSMGRGRVAGADPHDTYQARKATWQRVLVLVNRAHGTPQTFIREPSDVDLERMKAHAQGELDALDAAEDARRHAQRTRRERERERELVEPRTTLVGPRQWLGPDGKFV